MKRAKEYSKFTAKEWNAGGAYQFYGSRKPRSYILEVETTDLIDGDVLQTAVDKALKRMPYYDLSGKPAKQFIRKTGSSVCRPRT